MAAISAEAVRRVASFAIPASQSVAIGRG
jgi:hypothetical protein